MLSRTHLWTKLIETSRKSQNKWKALAKKKKKIINLEQYVRVSGKLNRYPSPDTVFYLKL